MAQDPKENINESASYIRDTLSSVAGVFAEQLKDATRNAFSSAEATSIRDVSRQLTQTFRELNKNVLDSKKNQDDLSKGILKTVDVEKQLNTLQEKRNKLALLVNEAKLKGVKLDKEAFLAAKSALDDEKDQLETNLQLTKSIDKAAGASGKLASALKEIPGLGKLIDAGGIEKSLRSAAAAGGGTLSTFSKIKAIGTSLATTFFELFLSPEALFAYLIKAGFAADEQVTKLAKSLNQTKMEALGTRYEMSAIANASGDAFITTDKLLESTAKLGQQLGIAQTFSADLTKEFTSLTGKIGLSEESAGGLAKLTVAMGKNARTVTTEALGTAQALESQAGIQLDNRQILEEVGKVSGQLLANFKGNPTAIAAAVTQAKLLGTTLEQTKKQSESLLDFQSSIENELKAELITGQQLNLERARALALSGDQAGVAKELANQNMNFNKFSQMNVLAQKDFAAALGLSADELSDQLLKQQYLNKSTKEVAALAGEDVARRLEALTAQDKFNNAVSKLQDILVRIVDGPIGMLLDGLASTLSLLAGDTSGFKAMFGADDLMSGYGQRTLSTPQGSYALNNNDTVIAGTNLFRGNDVYSGPAGALSLGGGGAVVDAIAKLGDRIDQLSERPVIARPSEFATPITIKQQQNIRRSI
jgi:hypothetical protein